MKRKFVSSKLRRWVTFLLLSLSILFLFLTIYSSFSFIADQKGFLNKAYLSAKNQAVASASIIDKDFFEIIAITQATANDLTNGTLQPEDVTARLKTAAAKSKMIADTAVAFNPYAYSPKLKLYAPIYLKDSQNNWLLKQMTYDYTKPKLTASDPETDWYLKPARLNSAMWLPPFYGATIKELIGIYSVPFYYPHKGTALSDQRGIVVTAVSLKNIDLSMAQLNLGKTGYAFVTSQEGIIIAHPDATEIGKKSNLDDLVKYEKFKIFSYKNPVSDQEYWTFSFKLKSTGWKLVIRLSNDDFAISPAKKMKQLSFIISLGLLAAIFLTGFLLYTVKYNTRRKWWYFSLVTSGLCFLGIVLIWDASFRISRPETGTKIIEQAQLSRFLLTHDIATKKILIPTGILVNDISFVTPETAIVNGIVWQRMPKESDQNSYGFSFPQRVGSVDIQEIAEKNAGDEKIIFWSFYTMLKQNFFPVLYPLDKENFAIKILPKNVTKNYFLIPDLKSYSVLKPTTLPGVKSGIDLSMWKLDASFFSFEDDKSSKNIIFFKGWNSNNLQFNVSLHRYLINSFIHDFVPMLLVAVTLFAVLATNMLTAIISMSGAMLFFLAISQSSMRNYIAIEGLSYFDYLYVFMYFFITWVAVGSIVAAKFFVKSKIFKNNMITKILYWPIFSICFYIITTSLFG
jgi:hypothetical protein